jgi:hypothetical protein
MYRSVGRLELSCEYCLVLTFGSTMTYLHLTDSLVGLDFVSMMSLCARAD